VPFCKLPLVLVEPKAALGLYAYAYVYDVGKSTAIKSKN
jgi:hypothetical protein